MPPALDRPIRKVTLNLYEEDVAQLVSRFGRGWTAEVRDLVHLDCNNYRSLLRSFDEAQKWAIQP